MNGTSIVKKGLFLSLFFTTISSYAGVIGYIDNIIGSGTDMVATGWACDQGVAQSIEVHGYVGKSAFQGGSMIAIVQANLPSEAAINSACGTPANINHRFQMPFSIPARQNYPGQLLFVHGISKTNQSNAAIQNPGQFKVPSIDLTVKGLIDSVTTDANKNVIIQGWACQNLVNASIDLHMYVGASAWTGGAMVATTTANLPSNAGVTAVCGTNGTPHGFTITMARAHAAPHAGKNIFIHGLALISGVDNSVINANYHRIPQVAELSDFASAGQDVVIPKDAIVPINTSINVGTMEINGRLVCPATGNYTIETQGIIVSGAQAALECGNENQRFNGNLQILINGGRTLAGAERSVLALNGGTIKLWGQAKNHRWLRIAETAQAGSSTIKLEDSVDWSVGDEIVIGPTGFDPSDAERRTITAINNSTRVVTLNAPLQHFHWGQPQTYQIDSRTWSLEQRAEVANLSRNIKIVGNGTAASMDYRGGHIMVMKGAFAYIDGIELRRMGRMGEMMRYPFHWHIAGDVEGQFIRNSAIHESFQRCITVHGTHKAVVQNNVCFDFYGHGIFLEDGNETGNSIQSNLAILARKPLPNRHLLQSDIDDTNPERWKGPAAFWISNPANAVDGNVAAGSEGTGFWMSFEQATRCVANMSCVPTAPGTPGIPANEMVYPAKTGTMWFSNNTAHSARIGFTWDGAMDANRPANNPRNSNDRLISASHYYPGGIPSLGNLRGHKNIVGIYVRADTIEFHNSVFADNNISLFFAFNQIYRDGAVIGKSANHDTVRDYNNFLFTKSGMPDTYTGVWIYDGAFELRNVDFLGFDSAHQCHWGVEVTAVPFTNLGGENRFINRTNGLRFSPEPAERVRFIGRGLVDSMTTTMIRDLDGTLSGRSGGAIMMANHKFNNYRYNCDSSSGPLGVQNTIIASDSINYDNSCTAAPSSPTAIACTADRGILKMHVYNDGFDEYRIPFDVTRNDGKTLYGSANAMHTLLNSSPWLQNTKVGMTLNKGFEYKIDFSDTYVTQSSPNKTFLFWWQSESIGQMSPVIQLSRLGNACTISGLASVSSLAALRSSANPGYFTSGQNLYFKTKTTFQKDIFIHNPSAPGATTGTFTVSCP